MNTYIYCVFQRQDEEGTWLDVVSQFKENGNVLLFAWLADVRNFGNVTPLSEPRGLPADFLTDGDNYHPIEANQYRGPWAQALAGKDSTPEKADCLFKGMGDSNHSWLDAEEILGANDEELMSDGVITIENYRNWSGCGRPEGLLKMVPCQPDEIDNIKPETTHVHVTWTVSLLHELAYFVDEVRRLRDLYGKVRVVFGFDS